MTTGIRPTATSLAVLAALVAATLVPAPAAAGPARPAGWAGHDRAEAAPAPVVPPPVLPADDPLLPTGSYIPSLSEAGSDNTALHRAGCQQGHTDPRLIICVRGDPDGKKTVMLAGASHATQWFPAVNRIARDRGWRLLTAVKAGCRLNLSRKFANTASDQSCKTWLEALMARIRSNPPAMIITTGTVTELADERLPSGYLDMWRRFNRLGIRVVAIRDTPRASFDRVTCLRKHPAQPGRCAVARNPTLDPVSPLVRRRDELPANVTAVDLTSKLCTATTCPAVSGSYVIYRDAHHLTETFARRLASSLGAQIP
jgi:hypothetical protein